MGARQWGARQRGAILGCASALVLALPAHADAPSSVTRWTSKTIAEALQAIAANGKGNELRPGGALAVDRGVGSLVGGLRSASPALRELDLEVDVDPRFRPALALRIQQTAARTSSTRLTIGAGVGHLAAGRTEQRVQLGLERAPEPEESSWLPRGGRLELAHARSRGSRGAVYTLAGRVRWTRLEVGGRLQDERTSDSRAATATRPIDAAEMEIVADVPGLTFAEFEARRSRTPAREASRLACTASGYLLTMRPLGPLQVTTGHHQADPRPADWYTSIRLKLALGGPA